MNNLNCKKVTAKHFFIFLFTFSCVFFQGLNSPSVDQTLAKEAENVEKYNFSVDWFGLKIPTFEKLLSQFKGKPNIYYLEIGVFEGRSAIWMLENILTHSTAKLTCIDIFPGNLKEVFFTNLEISGFTDKVTTITGQSQIGLRHLPFNSFDIIYIDGSHTADNVLADAVFSWPLLKSGGVLIFDDYLWEKETLPKELRPQIAIDAFIEVYKNYIDIVHHGFLLALRKREVTFSSRNYYYIGQYVYSWHQKELYRLEAWRNGEAIELSDMEKELIEKLVKSGKFEGSKFSLDSKTLKDEEFLNLKERLGLKLEFEEGEEQ